MGKVEQLNIKRVKTSKRLPLYIITTILFTVYIYNKLDSNISLFQAQNKEFKFLHISDLHYDKDYTVGGSPVARCHRKVNHTLEDSGKFGMVHKDCDSPFKLINSTLTYVKDLGLKYIIDTGDVSRHTKDDKINVTYHDKLQDHKTIVSLYNNYIDFNDTQIFPNIGNNDVFPHNFATRKNPIYKDLIDIWRPYNLDINTKEFKEVGTYKQKVKGENLVLMSINTITLFRKNLYTNDCSDLESAGNYQLNVLEKWLRELESNNKAIITGHVPPNDKKGQALYHPQCYKQFLNIVGKYSHKIMANFHGHTNTGSLGFLVKRKDEYNLITMNSKNHEYNPNIKQVFFNAPSIVPEKDPRFRVYAIEKVNNVMKGKYDYVVKQYKQYTTSLKKANVKSNLEYYVQFDTLIDLGVGSFSLSNCIKLYNRIIQSESNFLVESINL